MNRTVYIYPPAYRKILELKSCFKLLCIALDINGPSTSVIQGYSQQAVLGCLWIIFYTLSSPDNSLIHKLYDFFNLRNTFRFVKL